MSGTKFSVSWQAYQNNLCNGLSFLQQREEFVDMTIAADGHMVKVHRMVMSLVSPFIKELITSAQCPHPVIFLNRVSYQTLQLILEYAYTGQVVVEQENLNDFLEVSHTLHIKGLENMVKSTTQAATHLVEDQPQDASINVSQLAANTTDAELSDDGDNIDIPMDQDLNETSEVPDQDDSFTDKDTRKGLDILHKTSLQYSVSYQGTLQLIYNRYIYSQRYTRKDNTKSWRCYQYRHKSCQGCVETKGNKVVQRMGVHNHPFHDAQILKRMQRNNVFAVEPKSHQIACKMVDDKVSKIQQLLE